MARKKAKDTLIGLFVLLVLVVAVFEKIGWIWFGVIVAVGAVVILFRHFYTGLPKVPTDEFGPILSDPQSARQYLSQLMKKDPRKAMRLRVQQVIRESLQIALTSKKRDTADSRMGVAQDRFEELNRSFRVPRKELQLIEQRLQSDKKEFETVKYINQAEGLIERGSKLKTEKSRQKYLDQAKAVIKEGMSNPESDKERLRAFLDDMPKTLSEV